MQLTVGPQPSIGAQPALFTGFRSPDAQEPGIPMRDAHPRYHYIRDTQFEEIVADAKAKTFSIEDFAWETDIVGSLRTQLDAKTPMELWEAVWFARPALISLRDDSKKELTGGERDAIAAVEAGDKAMLAFASASPANLDNLKASLIKAQLRALNSMANHALTAEEPSVAPLSFGITKYSKRTDVRDAFHSFSGDEAKHTHILMRYVEKLGEDRQVSPRVEGMFKVFGLMAKVNPAAAIFLALNVEAQGGSYFEFMGQNAPDPLYRKLCQTIYEKDEARHVKVMQELYNLMYRNPDGSFKNKWEQLRNKALMKFMLHEGKKQDLYPYMTNACYAFGVDPEKMREHRNKRVGEAFAAIGYDLQ